MPIELNGNQYYFSANAGDTRNTPLFASLVKDVELLRLAFKPYDTDFLKSDISAGKLNVRMGEVQVLC